MTLTPAPSRTRPALALGLLAVILCFVSWLIISTELFDVVSFKTVGLHYAALRDWVTLNRTPALIAYCVIYIVLALTFIPASGLMIVACGLLFGGSVGFAIAMFASLIGASLTFVLAKTLFDNRLRGTNATSLEAVRTQFQRHGMGYMLGLRLIPGVPFALANVIPALIGVPFITYMTATALGIIPMRVVLSTAGAGLGHVIDAKNIEYATCAASSASTGASCPYEFQVSALLTNDILAAFVGLAVLALLPAVCDAIGAVCRGMKRRRDQEQ
jgi:uncharacterized membrane protein YdjX (TVP38/TMEM64 family)